MAAPTVLLVEDERIIAMDMKFKLKKMGISVAAHVASGEEALRKLEEVKPDLVLMDIMLEGEIDGIETTARLKERFDIPVIYATAYADEDTRKRAAKTDPCAYLTKPVDEFQLRNALRKALGDQHQILDTPPTKLPN